MVSVPSGVRYSLGLAAAFALIVSCAAAAGPDEGGVGGNCGPLPCPTGSGDSGGGPSLGDAKVPPSGDDDSGSTGDDDATTGDDDGSTGDDDTSTGDDSSTGGDTGGGKSDASSGNWVDMTNNAAGCDQKAGVPCGWASANNGVGDVCACREGQWADGWTCEAPSAPTVAGPACPGVVTSGDSGTTTVDSGAIDAAKPPTDSGTTTDAAVGWIDMDLGAASCEHQVNVPCGWNATNNGTGYTCACRHGTWAEPWTCELAGTASTPGPGCP